MDKLRSVSVELCRDKSDALVIRHGKVTEHCSSQDGSGEPSSVNECSESQSKSRRGDKTLTSGIPLHVSPLEGP